MKQHVTLDKRSKRKQKEFHDKQRSSWGAVKPATRTFSDKKKYDRKRSRREFKDEFSPASFIFVIKANTDIFRVG